MTVYCTNCGRRNPAGAGNCSSCGESLLILDSSSRSETGLEYIIRFVKKHRIALALVGFVAAGLLTIRAYSYVASRPMLTQVEAVQIANAAAVAKGINLGNFRPPRANYGPPYREWLVCYSVKRREFWEPPGTGVPTNYSGPGSIVVTVHDRTRQTRVDEMVDEVVDVRSVSAAEARDFINNKRGATGR